METNNDIKGIKYENLHAGVGFVIIPKNVDRDVYVKDCYLSGRISIFGGQGHSNFYNILINKETLQEVDFPEKEGSFGSPVLWVNIPKHNEPVVVCSFKYDEKTYNFSEFSRKITKIFKENIVELFLDAKNSKAKFSMNSQDSFSDFEINLNSKNSDSKFITKVDGTIITHSTKKMLNVSNKSIIKTIIDKEGNIVSRFSLDNDEETNFRLRFEDEFGNRISSDNEKLHLDAKNSKRIQLGNGQEPVVLAQKLKAIFEDYDDALSRLTVPTAFGPSGTRINNEEFLQIRKRFEEFFSKITYSD